LSLSLRARDRAPHPFEPHSAAPVASWTAPLRSAASFVWRQCRGDILAPLSDHRAAVAARRSRHNRSKYRKQQRDAANGLLVAKGRRNEQRNDTRLVSRNQHRTRSARGR
jgi:hypothetical protein